jgi:hypothetical protein
LRTGSGPNARFLPWFASRLLAFAVILGVAHVIDYLTPGQLWTFALFRDLGIAWAFFLPEHFSDLTRHTRNIYVRSALLVAVLLTANVGREAVRHSGALSPAWSNAAGYALSIVVGATVIFFIGSPGDDNRSIRAKRAAGVALRKFIHKRFGGRRDGA